MVVRYTRSVKFEESLRLYHQIEYGSGLNMMVEWLIPESIFLRI